MKRIEHKAIIDTIKTVYANFLSRIFNGFFDSSKLGENSPDLEMVERILKEDFVHEAQQYLSNRMDKLAEAIANGTVKETVRGTSLRNVVQGLSRSGKNKLSQQALDRATSIGDTLKNEMKTFFKDVADRNLTLQETKDLLKEKFKGKITEGKADTIARTEYRSAQSYGQNDAVEQMAEKGIKVVRIWRTSGSNTRPSHDIDGEEALVNERFSNGLLYPMEDGAPPEEVINCDCYIEIQEIGD